MKHPGADEDKGVGAVATDRDSRRPELRRRQGLEGTDAKQVANSGGGWEAVGSGGLRKGWREAGTWEEGGAGARGALLGGHTRCEVMRDRGWRGRRKGARAPS